MTALWVETLSYREMESQASYNTGKRIWKCFHRNRHEWLFLAGPHPAAARRERSGESLLTEQISKKRTGAKLIQTVVQKFSWMIQVQAKMMQEAEKMA